jgi:hypothetical protein
MLSDDLGFFVAFEAPCAGIPAAHYAFGVQHINGIVGHRLHEHAVTALGRVRGFKSFLTLQINPGLMSENAR